jgi:ABC-type methionine transport system ATPase subunit
MKLVIPPLEIDKEDPFKHDVLNRKEFATALLNLVLQINEGVVISLDASWGEGKTTFVRMWQGLLRTNHIKIIYVDAFITDFIDIHLSQWRVRLRNSRKPNSKLISRKAKN